MPRPDLSRVPVFYHNYINQVKEDDLAQAFTNQTTSFMQLLEAIPENKRDFSYAAGKWTIKEMLQHILDAERIFAYRALSIARKETAALPSFDENDYANHSKAATRKWDDLVQEFMLVRQSNEILFQSFDEEQLNNTGTASGKPVYVLGIGYLMVGHVAHHVKVMKERYL